MVMTTADKGAADAESSDGPAKRGWLQALAAYCDRRVVPIWGLGFSAGLPILLVFSTLSAWLREGQISLKSIGFVSYVLLAYSLKFLWAPLVDRLPIPGLTRMLGRRRGWILFAQFCVMVGLSGMALTDPQADLGAMVAFGLMVAFSSATQDIAIDAYRIEAAEPSLQATMAGAYIYGYRLGMLVAGGGALILADKYGWMFAYLAMAAAMGVGVITVLLMPEPQRPEVRQAARIDGTDEVPSTPRQFWVRRIGVWLLDAVFNPFLDFFRRNGLFMAVIILAFVGLYRLSDIVMGVMAIPLYVDLGFSKATIGAVTKGFGLGMTLVGVFLGGVLVARFGIMRPLLLGAIMVALTNLLFVLLASSVPRFPIDSLLPSLMGDDIGSGGLFVLQDVLMRALAWPEPDRWLLVLTISGDNLSGGLASTCFIAYLSTLTNRAYTATQYALFSSFMTLPGKLLAGMSGVIVEKVGYVSFFTLSSILGVPAILLVLYLWRRHVTDRRRTATISGES